MLLRNFPHYFNLDRLVIRSVKFCGLNLCPQLLCESAPLSLAIFIQRHLRGHHKVHSRYWRRAPYSAARSYNIWIWCSQVVSWPRWIEYYAKLICSTMTKICNGSLYCANFPHTSKMLLSRLYKKGDNCDRIVTEEPIFRFCQ